MARSLAFVSPYTWIFWAVFLFCYVPEFGLIARSKAAPGEKTDRKSTLVIVLAGWIGFPIAFSVANLPQFLLGRGQKFWFALGILCLLMGTFLRRHCWKMLGRYFTGNVRISEGQIVIQDGAYRWVRHPSYTGGMLMYLGTGLAMTNWLSVLVLFISGGLGYAYRVKVEEQALVSSLGEPYSDYMRRTKRFIPFVF